MESDFVLLPSRSYRRNIEQHVLPEVGHLKLQSLTAAHLNALYRGLEKSGRKGDRRRGAGLHPRTVYYIHTIIRRALKDAVRQKLVVVNVALAADPPTAKMASEAAPEIKTWSASELERFLTFTKDDRYGPAWLFLATTAMHRGEAFGLRWTDLTLEAEPPTATIRRAAIMLGHRREGGKTKTGNERLIKRLGDGWHPSELEGTPSARAPPGGPGLRDGRGSDLHAARRTGLSPRAFARV